ncbi:MAG TPA: phytoene desaturase family protein [Chitinophagaceae bacterium]|nr:phytoene desaturase family protein [Chitinophagaceae bacterium]
MSKNAVVIGSGFAGLSAASFMAKAGWRVTVLEKHDGPGGRARQLKDAGFSFDMGPSWYWMPDIFERYFSCFGKKAEQYYSLQRLDPAYRVYWPDGPVDIPDRFHDLKDLFESIEPGAAGQLEKFTREAAYKYKTGMQNLVFKPGQSYSEFLDWEVIKGVFRLDVFTSMKRHIGKYFKHPRLQQLLEFPILFLGALPENTPALYSLMNYAAFKGGTWYPQGGMYSVVDAMYKLALELGVVFRFNENATGIATQGDMARKVITGTNEWEADVVIGGADYHFIESHLLPPASRSYTDSYWNKRVMAPSCLLYYIGLNKRLDSMAHHSLFFDAPFEQHSKEIYTTPQWPSQPLFYASIPSVTDRSVAPPGGENLFLLIPVAAGLEGDTEALRSRYFDNIIGRLEKHIHQPVASSVIYSKSFGCTDFVHEYNAYKGNAYGLANTLLQTAVLKPSCRSRKLKNLFYTGQLTVPGPGVPPALISGEVVAGEVTRHFGKAGA